jgi:hypothetical protein
LHAAVVVVVVGGVGVDMDKQFEAVPCHRTPQNCDTHMCWSMCYLNLNLCPSLILILA